MFNLVEDHAKIRYLKLMKMFHKSVSNRDLGIVQLLQNSTIFTLCILCAGTLAVFSIDDLELEIILLIESDQTVGHQVQREL